MISTPGDVFNHLDINTKAVALKVMMYGPLATGIQESSVIGQ